MIQLGVDTLTYHLRIETGATRVEDVLIEAAELGCSFVQITLHHVRDRTVTELATLRERAADLGLLLFASGDVLGRRRDGDQLGVAETRVAVWLERASALGSPFLRVVSGFYRADLAGRPDLIELEGAYVVEALRHLAPAARARGIRLLLENHSDFRVAEYESIIAAVGVETVGVFLDLINPISGFEDPLPVVAGLAPHAWAGHVKDFQLTSLQTDDGYHRRGFSVTWCYPGEGVADLTSLLGALRAGIGEREMFLSIEGLDNYADHFDQRQRLQASLGLLRSLLA